MASSAVIDCHYLPSVAYMAVLAHSDVVSIECHENYQKGSYRNRCHVMSANGLLRLSLPLIKGKHQRLIISKVRLDNDSHFQKQHWQSIKSAYGRSPYFEFYEEDLNKLLTKKFEFLLEYNLSILNYFLTVFSLKTDLNRTSRYEQDSSFTDYRGRILPSVNYKFPDYIQVFADKIDFISNLSALDILLNLGPNEGADYINRCVEFSLENNDIRNGHIL